MICHHYKLIFVFYYICLKYSVNMLQINNACIAYGKDVLFSNFNMHLKKGEMSCISGQSGCGKTSLLNAIMGFVPLCEGSITVNNIPLNKHTIDSIRYHIAWVPQELALPSEWVSEMVHLPFELKINRKKNFSEEKLFSCFHELGLEEDIYRKRVVEISGGQRQRVMLAIAVLLDKPLIIIDEPTSALDGDSMDKVLAFFRRSTEKGTAILSVSHDENFASGCDSRIKL